MLNHLYNLHSRVRCSAWRGYNHVSPPIMLFTSKRLFVLCVL